MKISLIISKEKKGKSQKMLDFFLFSFIIVNVSMKTIKSQSKGGII